MEEVGLKGKGNKKPHEVHGVKVEKERQALKNQIDAMVAKIYKLTREELEYILSTFPLVKDEVKLGVLEEYDRL